MKALTIPQAEAAVSKKRTASFDAHDAYHVSPTAENYRKLKNADAAFERSQRQLRLLMVNSWNQGS